MNLDKVHWMPIGPAPVDTPGKALGRTVGRIDVAAPDPGNVDTMYVGGSGGGIWKTGVWTHPDPVWLPFTDDQPSINVAGYHSLVVHPAHHETVFALVSGPGGGLLKSTDFGLAWHLLGNDTFEGAALHAIAVHPTNVDILYVAVTSGGSSAPGVYKTTDGGAHWTNTTSSVHSGAVNDVIVAKWDHKTLFAGMIPGSDNAGVNTAAVYRSTDEGAHWHALAGTGLPSNFFVRSFIRLESATEKGRAYATIFTFDTSADGKDMVGRYRTTNGGDHWDALAPTPGTLEDRSWHVLLGVDPKDGKHIFANDSYALFESTDSGHTWKRADVANGDNIGSDWVNICFDARNNAVVTADQGVYHFDFVNNKWEHRCGNLQVAALYTITVTPQNVDRCYGIAQDFSAAFKFTGSVLWKTMPGGSGETGKVLVDPADKSRLYAFDPLAPKTGLVKTSTDGGQNWTVIHTDSSFDNEDYSLAYSVQKSFAMDPSNSKRLLLGLTKVFECKDGTAAIPVWKAISGVLSPGSGVGSQYITALAIAASSGKVIYAATADGHVWTTANDGVNWTQSDTGLLGSGVGKVVDIRIDPTNTKRAFAVSSGAAGKNIWFHDPADGEWKNISGNMPWNLGVVSIAVDWRFTPNVLYVGSARGVYRSIDEGVHWVRFAKNMPNTPVSDLQTLPTHNILAASTSGRGVFEILLSDPKTPSPVPPEIVLRPRPEPFADVGGYEQIGDLILLPGKQPGQALAGARVRNVKK
jgi:photosystem II stability/assembly factor-like uncharacterized protein